MTNTIKKISEYKFRKLTKLSKEGINSFEVIYDGQVAGTVERCFHGWRALGLNGENIGLGTTRHEAKWFVAEEFVGMDNVEWKN